MNTLILDNGSCKIKGGWWKAGADNPANNEPGCFRLHNGISKSRHAKGLMVGDDVIQSKDQSGMTYRSAFHLGHLVNWQAQCIIWDHYFNLTKDTKSNSPLACNPEETQLLVTDPVLELPNIQESYDEIVFEDYGFASYCRKNAPSLASYNQLAWSKGPCQLIIDSGYAFTHIVPIFNHFVLNYAIKRIQVGGKLLTNYLKEVVSYRQWNMMEETFIINDVKETTCFISDNVERDLEICKRNKRVNPIVMEYVLPDLRKEKRGTPRTPLENADPTSKEQEQVLLMNNERFMVPELLFSPMNIGLNQAGIAEAVVQAVDQTPKELHPLFYANVVVIGGNARFPGFQKRLEEDLRKMVPENYVVQVVVPPSPDEYAWRGAYQMCSERDREKIFVSKAEYAEFGHNVCRRRFGF